MGFSVRFGGWRPVQLEEGQGILRVEGEGAPAAVEYRFEVWHQMVAGFPGPFRSEGRLAPVAGATPPSLRHLHGRPGRLELDDGRRLELTLTADLSFVAHARPEAPASKG